MAKMLKTREVAELLGLHPETVREMIRDGRLSATRLGPVGKGGRWRVSESDLAKYLGSKERAKELLSEK